MKVELQLEAGCIGQIIETEIQMKDEGGETFKVELSYISVKKLLKRINDMLANFLVAAENENCQ